MIKKILSGILGLMAVVVIIGILQPAEVVIEEQYIIKEPVDKLQTRLSDDVSMAQWFSEATGRRIQTVEQENSRGKGHGRLVVDEAALSEVAASVNVHFYKPLRHYVHTNFFLTATSEGTAINTFSVLQKSGWSRFVGWIFGPGSRWTNMLGETMETIKEEAESDFVALIDGFYIERQPVIERNYLLVRSRRPFEEMNEFGKENFPRLDYFIQQERLRRFPFSTLYYDLNVDEEMADMAAAVRIDRDLQTPPEDLDIKFLRRGEVVSARHYGPVEEVVEAHRAIRQYLEENNLQFDPPFIETYEVGARDVDDREDFVTLVEYYLFED